MVRWTTWCVTALLCLLLSVRATGADSQDREFLAGLRQRQLYELAESYCATRLANTEISPQRRAFLTVELARTVAERALQTDPNQRAALWERALRVTADFHAATPHNPWQALVDLQESLVWLDRAELTLEEVEIAADKAPLQEIRDALRAAIRGLQQVDRAIASALRNDGKSDQSGPTAAQWAALQKNVGYQLARAYRNQAMSYPRDSPDWSNSLTLALERLTPLAELTMVDETVWSSRLERIHCQRLLGRLDEAERSGLALLDERPPPEVAAGGRAELIHIALAGGRLPEALELVNSIRPGSSGAATLDLACLEAALAAYQTARQARQPDDARRWQQRAAAWVASIRQDRGAYWVRRSDMALAAAMGDGIEADVDVLVQAAESFYRSGNVDRALATYDRAAAAARQQPRQQRRAFKLAFTAAAIEHARKQHAGAADRFRRLAIGDPEHPDAVRAHRLAITNTAAVAQAMPLAERAAMLSHYRDLLNEHLRIWGGQAAADPVRIWLGQWHSAKRQWRQAVDAYRDVGEASPLRDEALRNMAACYGAWLDEAQQNAADRARLADEAAGELTRSVLVDGRIVSDRLTQLDQFCVTAAAKLRLQHAPASAGAVERLMSQAIRTAPDAAPDWLSEARLLLVYALAVQGKRKQAAELLEEITAGPLELLVATLDAFGDLTPGDAATRQSLGELQLQIVARIEPRQAELDAATRVRVRRRHAAGLALAGHRRQALTAYEQLASAHPRSGDLQEARAELLQQTDDRDELQQALAAWKRVVSGSQEGTPRWFRARYAEAEAIYRLGDRDAAAKLIRLTGVLQPDWGGPEMKRRFDALLERCAR